MVFEILATAVIDLLGLTDRSAEVVEFWIYSSSRILLILFTMVLVIGFIRTYLSPEKIREVLKGKKAVSGYFIAALSGVVSPFCSCSTIPLYLGFSKSGIPTGMTLTFLFVSPMVNTAAVVVLFTVLGVIPTLIYVLGGLTVGVLGGLLLSKTFFDENSQETLDVEVEKESIEIKERVKKSYREAKKLVKDVLPYVIIGTGIGALIRGLVPEELIANYLTGNLAVPGAVILGTPIYTNIMGVIPIAESLISKGLPIGTALAFMMSVAALSLPKFFMLKKVMTRKELAAYGVTLTLGIITVGLLTNLLI